MDIKNTYLGYTDNMSPMQKARAENTLDKLIRSDGKVMTQKEWIIHELKKGSKPHIEHNYSYYSHKTGQKTKPKDDYRLITSNDTFYQITKTEYEFAQYILENDLTDEAKINEYITVERNRNEENNRLKAEQEKVREEKRRAELEFETWLQNKANEYNNSKKLELAKTIFFEDHGRYNEQYLAKLLVLIENIDNSKCRTKLKEILHTHNKTSKKIFYSVTGIKLPNTDKGTMEILDKITVNDYQIAI